MEPWTAWEQWCSTSITFASLLIAHSRMTWRESCLLISFDEPLPPLPIELLSSAERKHASASLTFRRRRLGISSGNRNTLITETTKKKKRLSFSCLRPYDIPPPPPFWSDLGGFGKKMWSGHITRTRWWCPTLQPSQRGPRARDPYSADAQPTWVTHIHTRRR